MKRFLAFAGLAVLGLACNKVVPVPEAGVTDGGTATAGTGSGAVATADLDASVEAAAPLTATTPTAVHTAAHTTTASGGPFQGSFNCGISTTQNGTTVSGTMKGSSFTCTTSGDLCDGHINVKTGAKTESRHMTLKRNAAGDVTYHGDGEPQPTFCKKQ